MPVHSKMPVDLKESSTHQIINSPIECKFYFLCDRFDWNSHCYSLGDIFICLGIMATLIYYIIG